MIPLEFHHSVYVPVQADSVICWLDVHAEECSIRLFHKAAAIDVKLLEHVSGNAAKEQH
jgi:hypothetical protein